MPEEQRHFMDSIFINGSYITADTSFRWENRMYHISFQDEFVVHFGYDIELGDYLDSNEALIHKFIERITFDLSLEKSVPDVVSKAESYQIKLYYMDDELLFSHVTEFDEFVELIISAKLFNLTRNQNWFIAEWVNGVEFLKIVFPNNYQLIRGKNKKELDEELLTQLFLTRSNKPQNSQANSAHGKKDTLPVYLKEGKNYMNKLSSDCFFWKLEDDSIPVFGEDYPEYSFSNLFLLNEISKNKTLNLDQKLYGHRSYEFETPLGAFLNYFQADYDAYFGLEEFLPPELRGTLVLSHKYFNFIHLLYIKTDTSELFSDSGKIDANLYSNIPMNNVSNLFKEFEVSPYNEKIKISIN